MNGRTLFLIVLGMSASFSLVLGVMLTLVGPDLPATGPKAGARTKSQVTAPNRRANQPVPQETTSAAKTQSPAQTHRPSSNQPVSITAPKASKEIDLLKKSLGEQIGQLKKDRDVKLSALARELALMTPSNAAAQLSDLDDEAAALTLAKMPADKRAQVLKETENRRATRLKKRLQEIR